MIDVGGRPAAYKTAKQLAEKINNYFNYIQGDFKEVEDAETQEVRKVYTRYPESPAITSLAFWLGFESRQSFYDYEKKKGFTYTVKKARLAIESFYEQNLMGKNVTGAIFALKNFGWADKQEVLNTNVNYNSDPITKEEIKKIAKDLEDSV